MAGAQQPRSVPATRDDLERLPPHLTGEIIDGVLHTAPRPRFRHSDIETFLGADLKNPFQRGRGGPGGWWILIEPGIELPEAAEVVPDVAAWRRERLPHPPVDTPIRVVPDWVCEITSPGTRRYDQIVKRPFYARVGGRWMWVVDLDARTLTASRLAGGQWVELAVFGETDLVRAEPFEAIEISMADWWQAEPLAGL